MLKSLVTQKRLTTYWTQKLLPLVGNSHEFGTVKDIKTWNYMVPFDTSENDTKLSKPNSSL